MPRINDYSSQDIIKDLFEGNSVQQFNVDPVKQFTKNLRGTIRSRVKLQLTYRLGGVYNAEVYGYKKFIESMLDQLHGLKIKRDRLNLLQKSLANNTTTEYMTEITHDLHYEQLHDKPIKKKERSSGAIHKLIDDPKKSRKRKEREQTSSDDENGRESKRQKLVSIAYYHPSSIKFLIRYAQTESKKKDTSRSQMKRSHPPPPPIKPFSFFSSVYELFNLNNKEASTDLVRTIHNQPLSLPSIIGHFVYRREP